MEETRPGEVAALAVAVLDEEAARQEAQARATEQVIFPDELLPGVNSEPVTFREAFARGGKLMFVVLSLLRSTVAGQHHQLRGISRPPLTRDVFSENLLLNKNTKQGVRGCSAARSTSAC